MTAGSICRRFIEQTSGFCFDSAGANLFVNFRPLNLPNDFSSNTGLFLTVDGAVKSSRTSWRFKASERSVPEGIRDSFLNDVALFFRNLDQNVEFNTNPVSGKPSEATGGTIFLQRAKVVMKAKSFAADTFFSGSAKIVGKGTVSGGPNDGRPWVGSAKVKFKRSQGFGDF